MRRAALFAGLLISVLAPTAAFASSAAPAGGIARDATAVSVTRAFAAEGIPLQQKALLMAARGTSGLPKLFWNRTVASSQGVITVEVLRTVADAKGFPSRLRKNDTCGGFPTSYLTVRSRNVVATYTTCFNLSPAVHLATNPVTAGFVAAMQRLG